MNRTTLHDAHEALGAKMVDFAGWHMPVQYGPILEEVTCVRSRSGLFDLGHMGRVSVTGPDAVRFLDRIATTFVERIPEGAIRYGLFCREDGDPIDDLLIYKDGQEVFVVVNASNRDEDLAWMREHAAGFDVEITDRTDELAMIALQGQTSVDVLQQAVEDCDLGSIGYYRFGRGTLLGMRDIMISRTGYTGEDGFELYFPAAEAGRVWNALLELGKDHGLRPIGLAARDTLRLEAGMALYGHEIGPGRNPIEAGLLFGVSFKEEKGDWIGRDALARVKEQPERKLVGLTTPGPRVPRQDYDVVAGDEKVGFVCSGSVSPTLDTNIATAYVPLALATPGTALELEVRGKRQPCTVAELPFFSRTRK